MGFVHLHVHTQYSLLDGANKLDELIAKVKMHGMPAVAMTDHGNMFGAVEFYQKATAAGVQPILGCEVYMASGSRFDRGQRDEVSVRYGGSESEFGLGGNSHLIVLIQNKAGYRNMCRLLTAAYFEGLYRKPRIDRDILKEHSEGLIVLSGCMSGEVLRDLRNGNRAGAKKTMEWYAKTFPERYYIELQDNKLHAQYNNELRSLASELGLPVVATNDCHYLSPSDSAAHDVLLCVQTGKTVSSEDRWRFDAEGLYVKTPEEMALAFGAGSEEIRNTLDIAKRIEFAFEFGKLRFPAFNPGPGETLESMLEEQARSGLKRKLAAKRGRNSVFDEKIYLDRLARELEVIKQMGFCGYLLIVADFIGYARSRGIPVGPGRGSVVGSLVSWSLGITEVDPIEHKLLFERWLNPGRKSMPDIDSDFCWERRDEVLEYVRARYGADRVAQIITFGTIKGKQAIRDVGRALGLSFKETDRISKLYPAPKHGRDFPLKDALEMEPRLRKEKEKNPELFDYAIKFEGLLRHASRHAAGVVISDDKLSDIVPLYIDSAERGMPVTQFSMRGVEEIGLIKFDFLGLKNLTVIKETMDLIRASGKEPPDFETIGLDDPLVYQALSSGNTAGVFQLESAGMRRFLAELKPACFEDIVAALALFRPGPLDAMQDGKTMAQHYIDRKHGRERVEYDHPLLEPVLADTYGVIVYQEQVMRAAQALAGYTLQQADILRAAMGKKKPEVMERERVRFIDGACANGVSKSLADRIFNKIETFAAYGFNRSHATAYALTAFRTAYLKTHFPVEFMAALISQEIGNSSKMYKNMLDLRAMKIPLFPPSVNRSLVKFAPEENGIRFGLAGIKGVGLGTAQAIVKERERGPYRSIGDFLARLGPNAPDRGTMEMLVKAGAFDEITKIGRAPLASALEDILRMVKAKQRQKAASQMFLFDGLRDNGPASAIEKRLAAAADTPEWDEAQRLSFESEAVGFYMTSHPLDRFKGLFDLVRNITAASIKSADSSESIEAVSAAAVVGKIELKNTKKGERYAAITLDDGTGTVDAIAWPDIYQKYEHVLFQGNAIRLKGRLAFRDEHPQLFINEAEPLREAIIRAYSDLKARGPASKLVIKVPLEGIGDENAIERLRSVLLANHGKMPVQLEIHAPNGKAYVLAVGPRFFFNPSRLLEAFNPSDSQISLLRDATVVSVVTSARNADNRTEPQKSTNSKDLTIVEAAA